MRQRARRELLSSRRSMGSLSSQEGITGKGWGLIPLFTKIFVAAIHHLFYCAMLPISKASHTETTTLTLYNAFKAFITRACVIKQCYFPCYNFKHIVYI